ncbi:two-component system NtrC family sensor kinase [Methylobacterium sp. OAE515]|uniref:ATP-binding protein n=1 Tax=Methylobacterium sp. OAE515 TaxID=2817895 RepID=UPI0017893B6A
MRLIKPSFSWPLRLIVVLSLLGPTLLFAYAAWSTHAEISQRSDERIERALDILQEHTLKAFQTVERTLAETNEVLRGYDDPAIRGEEAQLSRRLRRIQDVLPQIQAIWVFDAFGHPLVSSTVFPVPASLNNADRDYFRAQSSSDAGTFIGEVVQSKVGNFRFFVVSARRPEHDDGTFNGAVAISLLPAHFWDFYERLSHGVADSFALMRADGAFLARFPQNPDRPSRLEPKSAFLSMVTHRPDSGLFTATSQIDGVERRIGYRRVSGYPIYAQAGIETATMWREWRQTLLGHLLFGLPATLALFGLALYALRRTEHFRVEVTRRENAEAALKQSQRLEAVGQLTGGIAHDFNNLLMVVSGNLERLKRYPVADERQRRALDAIEAAAQRGSSLTRQLLSFSRRQAHQAVPVDLNECLTRLEDMLRSSVRGDVAVEVQVTPGLWPTKVDLSELELAVLNLAVNARDAMPGGGRLTLAAQNVSLADAKTIGLSGDYVALSVTDTGTGMPPDVLARVFEPFFTTKEVGKGTGLGLSQVYGFAQQSGGTATVASHPGQGTTVTLYLPRTDEPVLTQSPQRADVAPARQDGRRDHVLLVEDNAEVADVSRGRLEELGFSVTHAPDPASALVILRSSTRIDLIFSDIVMPGGMNGLDLARAVRQEFGAAIPVVLATGYSDVAQQAAAEGFPLLRKPFDLSQMQEVLVRARQKTVLRVVA